MVRSEGWIKIAGLGVLLTVLLLWLYNLSVRVVELGVSSDAFYLFSLCEDLFWDGYSILGWSFPPSPYFFPDFLLLAPLYLLSNDVSVSIVLYDLIFWSAIFILLIKIGGFLQVSPVQNFNGAICIFLLFFHFVAYFDRREIPAFFMLPSYHSGCLLFGLLLLYFFLRKMEGIAGYKEITIVGLLTVLMVFSDSLFLSQFLLPVVSVVLVLALFRIVHWKQFMLWFFILLLAVQANSIFHRLLDDNFVYYISVTDKLRHFNAEAAHQTFQAFFLDMQNYLWSYSYIFYLMIVTLIAGVTFITLNCIPTMRIPIETVRRTILFLILFIYSSVTITIAAISISGLWNWFHNIRYVLNFLFLPFLLIFVLLLSLYHFIPRKFHPYYSSLILVISLVVVSLHLTTFSFKMPAQMYPKWIQELDRVAARHGLKYGYAEYWSAKDINVLSRTNLRANQIETGLFPRFWINNTEWYYTPEGEYPYYQFVITENLDTRQLVNVFGTPQRIYSAGHKEVWIYNRSTDAAFRNFLKPQLNHPELVHAPAAPVQLSRYSHTGRPESDPMNMRIEKDETLEVLFDIPAQGDVIDISVDGDDTYHVTVIFQGSDASDSELKFEYTIDSKGEEDMMVHITPLPAEMRNHEITRVEIRPVGGDDAYYVGHVFVYHDER
ncbi:MAG: hypothetical protein ACOX5R_11305 [bacterium]|jgi:hypothetical protein